MTAPVPLGLVGAAALASVGPLALPLVGPLPPAAWLTLRCQSTSSVSESLWVSEEAGRLPRCSRACKSTTPQAWNTHESIALSMLV
jgi:hypothetical protein